MTTWRSEMASLNTAHWSVTSVATRSQKISNPAQIKYGWSLHLMQPSIKQALRQISLKVCDLVPLKVKAGDHSSLNLLPSRSDQLALYLLVIKSWLDNINFIYKLLWEHRGVWCWGMNTASLMKTERKLTGSVPAQALTPHVAQLDRVWPPFIHSKKVLVLYKER